MRISDWSSDVCSSDLSGRISPYFFNAGLFNTGRSVGRLAQFYAQALIDSGVAFDMLFGPAYKGIPLATATAVALAGHPAMQGRDVPFAFNRKEAKDHGEGGTPGGAPLQGKVEIGRASGRARGCQNG